MMNFVPEKVENTVGRGENAGYPHALAKGCLMLLCDAVYQASHHIIRAALNLFLYNNELNSW